MAEAAAAEPEGGSMDGSVWALPPFLAKTYDMVDDRETDAVVAWTAGGASFVVHSPLAFSHDLLPKYFKHSNFSSFVRQLNTYGFHKVDPEQWEFANEDFLRGQKHRLKNIHRRKPIFSHSSANQGEGLLAERERQELEQEIARLKSEKGDLQLQLLQYTQKKHETDRRVQALDDRLHVIADRQKQILASAADIIKGPDFLPSFTLQFDVQSKKRRHKPILLREAASMDKDRVVGIPGSSGDPLDSLAEMAWNAESITKMESSLVALENLLIEATEAFGGDDSLLYEGPLRGPSTLVITELPTSPRQSEPSKPDMPSTSSKPCSSSPGTGDLAECASCAESTLPTVSPQVEACTETPKIDVNSSPAGVAGANDVFWQQFFTEHPGSHNAQEAQSERREEDSRRAYVRGNSWRNRGDKDRMLEEQQWHPTAAGNT